MDAWIFLSNGRKKRCQRWSYLQDLCPAGQQYDWYQVFQQKHNTGKEVHQIVSNMSGLYYFSREVPHTAFVGLMKLLEKDGLNIGNIVLDQLMDILHNADEHKNLTEKFYARKALQYVHHKCLRQDLEEFFALSAENQDLLTGLVWIAQWMQPFSRVTTSEVNKELDAIISLVMKHLQQNTPEHPSAQSIEAGTGTPDIVLSPQQCRTVLETLNYVLFQQLRYNEHYKEHDDSWHTLLINKALEKKSGPTGTIGIIYREVARRFGVTCEVVFHTDDFLIRWKEHPLLQNRQAYTYIDMYQQGAFHSEPRCPSNIKPEDFFHPLNNLEIFQKIVSLLIVRTRQDEGRAVSRMNMMFADHVYLLMCPDDAEYRLQTAMFPLHWNSHFSEALELLRSARPQQDYEQTRQIQALKDELTRVIQLQERETKTDFIPRVRSGNHDVTYSVGMIMRHRKYGYHCVIYGWDPKCKASKAWIVHMGVHMLSNKQHQPFYNVLVEDGTERYAAQENLEFSLEPKVITHDHVGKYFHTFCGTHYIPNAEKLKEYPQDMEVTIRMTEGRVVESFDTQQTL